MIYISAIYLHEYKYKSLAVLNIHKVQIYFSENIVIASKKDARTVLYALHIPIERISFWQDLQFFEQHFSRIQQLPFHLLNDGRTSTQDTS